MLFSLINFLSGYLIVEVRGFFIERFINLMIKRGIFMWDIKKRSKTAATMKVGVGGFKKMREAARKTKTTVRIKKRCGLPLFLHRYRHRRAFAAGIFLFAATLSVLTSFIWSVEIEGVQRIDENVLRNELRACGIDVGVIKYGKSSQQIKEEMLIKVPELSWIWVDIKGTKAFVEVKERIEKPEIVPADKPCNIVAERDGVVYDFIVKSGQPVIKRGSVVKKGDLLISGAVDSRFEGARLFHSEAEVIATTWREGRGEFPLVLEEREYSGRKKAMWGLEISGLYIRLWGFGKVDYDNFDYSKNQSQLRLWGDLYLPVHWVKEVYGEVYINHREMEEAEAAEHYGGRLLENLMDELTPDVQIINKTITHTIKENGNIEVLCTIECREEIGVKSALLEQEETLDGENVQT